MDDAFWGPDNIPGAHRCDRAGTGSYEQGNAVAIMDHLYQHVAHAVFNPWLPGDLFGQLEGLVRRRVQTERRAPGVN